MPDNPQFGRVDLAQLERVEQAKRPPLHIRWWIVPAAALICAAQALLNLRFESRGTSVYLIATQISVIAFGFLLALVLVVNPILRWTRLIAAMNRGELMALFAAMFVSAGISSFGLVDQLIPLIAAPFDSQWNTPQRAWDVNVIPHLNQALYITDTAAIAQYRDGFGSSEGLMGKIPWGLWARPVALWMLFVFAMYVMFYSLSMLVYDTWARREKLIFPLARLPEEIIHEEGQRPGTIPATIRSGLFWVGFLIVFVMLSYNGLCQAGWIRGLKPLHLGVDQNAVRNMLRDTIFEGIAVGGSLRFCIIFVAVGIGFLLPLEISFSLWIHKIIALLLFLIVIWMGIGGSENAFPTDWLWNNNFLTALGAGGLLAFSAAHMVKLACDRWALSAPEAKGERAPRRLSLAAAALLLWVAAAAVFVCLIAFGVSARLQGLWCLAVILLLVLLATAAWTATLMSMGEESPVRRTGSFLRAFGWGGLFFFASTGVALGWLSWAGVPIVCGLLFLAVVILVTLGLMRVVAEGGVYWFQIHAGPFHLARLLGGVKAIPAAALAPLMPIYSVLFLDIKTFMAPGVLTSLKMQEETRASRRRFHTAIVLAILVTVAVSLGTILYFAYEIGANQMSSWFFNSAPGRLLDQTQRLVSGALPDAGRSNIIFYLLGAGWVIMSMLLRRRFFWWLHPIGFVMLANPLMAPLWFSFFLGWLCKRVCVKYGGRHVFARMKPLFIGLIIGEVTACFLWTVLAYWLQLEHVKIDINRYYP